MCLAQNNSQSKNISRCEKQTHRCQVLKHNPCSCWISHFAAMIQLGDGIDGSIYSSRSLMMTSMSICIKVACFRSSLWFSMISVLAHLLHRAQHLRLQDGDIPYGMGTHNEANVHQAVSRNWGKQGGSTGSSSKNWGLSLAGGTGLSCQLCPSSIPLKVTLGPHITAAQRYSGSLQHTCSHIANGTGIMAAVWKRENV